MNFSDLSKGKKGMVILFSLLFVYAMAVPNKNKVDTSHVIDEAMREGKCEREIQKHLKDPTSFESLGVLHGVAEKKPGYTAVRITYLAKNSFNAKIKGQYQCVFDDKNKLYLAGEL